MHLLRFWYICVAVLLHFCQAKSFIRSLLEADPSKRLTAKEALEHTWLATKQEDP